MSAPGDAVRSIQPVSCATYGWESLWPAPAKLNLFLHVIGRRPDGYHLLQTVFRLIDWGDTLRFTPVKGSEVLRANPVPGVPHDTDLTVRAARLLQQETGCRQGVAIHLDKKLPMGGGLGGGSSNAATVLLALNYLWGLGLTRDELQRMALRLGADVPVFVRGHNAFAEGVGEQLTPVSLPDRWYLVLVPPVAVPTASVFQAPALQRNTPRLDPACWQPGEGHNDLEPVVATLFPAVAEYLAVLRQYAGPAMNGRMSGSGACIFAECVSRADATALQARLPAEWQGVVARGLPEHPLARI